MYGRNNEESYNITINHDCYYNVFNTCFHELGFYDLQPIFFTDFLAFFWYILLSIENFYFVERKKNLGKQFVGSGFVKTCDQQVKVHIF